MANFFTDNDDIRFLFDHLNLRELAGMMEEGFKYHAEYDFAPEDEDDAIENYRHVLTSLGQLAGEVIAPTAEETDKVGNTLNPDGTVTYAPGIAEAIKRLGQADMMGFTLPYKYGGLNCPQLLYSMSNDIVSRADASLMNIYGLQGIAETIHAYADDALKDEYLPRMAGGEATGAMVLTEPDAGSDLQAVKVRASQDEAGNWFVHGVKRFITNGCGEVLLVLARSEHQTTDGRGLSLFLVERGPGVTVRRLENKLGIKGSPTCELFFDNAPAKLIGERQRGLVTYVMNLMNGARIGIAAQSVGIGEAAYRVARDYAHSRKQFGSAIEHLPAVRELLVNMSIDLQAARVLTYYASYTVDLEYGATRIAEGGGEGNGDAKRAAKKEARKWKRMNGMLTPMSKYYASEMSMRVSNDAISVLGGSGYMKDYAAERHYRDARITTIYEGTTQLQIVAAVRGVVSGSVTNAIEPLLDREWADDLKPLIEQVREGQRLLDEAIAFVKSQDSNEYMDLCGRRLVDMGCALVIGTLFCDCARASERKKAVAARWLGQKLPEMRMLKDQICSGDRSVIASFDQLVGPRPTKD